MITQQRYPVPYRSQNFTGGEHRRANHRINHERRRDTDRGRNFRGDDGFHIDPTLNQVHIALHGDVRFQSIDLQVIGAHHAIFDPGGTVNRIKIEAIVKGVTEIEAQFAQQRVEAEQTQDLSGGTGVHIRNLAFAKVGFQGAAQGFG